MDEDDKRGILTHTQLQDRHSEKKLQDQNSNQDPKKVAETGIIKKQLVSQLTHNIHIPIKETLILTDSKHQSWQGKAEAPIYQTCGRKQEFVEFFMT